MYISRLHINPANRETMKAMAEPKCFHGTIERAFSGDRQRNLWRLDQIGNGFYLLIISQNEPDLTAAWKMFGFPNQSPRWESRPYEPLLERALTGSKWHFRLKANPVYHAAPDGPKKRGKVLPHTTYEMQERWLLDKATSYGFRVSPGEYLAVNNQRYRFKKRDEKKSVTLLSVTYEGQLTITDESLFRNTLTKGMGRGKAYGMGLLTIAGQERSV